MKTCPIIFAPTDFCKRPTDRLALTLLELMVVLVILAIVSTIAVQTLQPQVESNRIRAASSLLNEIEGAVCGPKQKFQADGTPLISGFVADVGRLPQPEPERVPSMATYGTSQILSELWNAQSQLAVNYPFQFRPGPKQPVDYSNISLACGWRSPYLQTPINLPAIVDPWGQAPAYVFNQWNEVTAVTIDVPPSAQTTSEIALSKSLTGGMVKITGTVTVRDPENTKVQIALLTPDPRVSLSTLVVKDDEDPQAHTFQFSNVPIGARALVADIGGRRFIKYLLIPHGGVNLALNYENEPQSSEN